MMRNGYDIAFIRENAESVLMKRGISGEDAQILVDSMLSADMCGVNTHGIRMLPSYISKLDQGHFSSEKPIVLRQLPSFTIIDAENSIGAISASFATSIAINQARNNGIHTVFSRNSNTFGPGFYYAEQIANRGMIGFVCSNSPAAMPAYNGLEVMLGTNPLAFAMPTKTYGNIVMDMATSIVAKSRFGVAKARGEKLEPGWALDKNGEPTTDPDEGIQGFVLPMAGFKGYGIAMMIDILSGFLSGASYLNGVGKFYSKDGSCMNVGHMIIAINPQLIYDGDFLSDGDLYFERLKSSKAKDGTKIVIPGEDRIEKKKKSLAEGITLEDETIMKLEQLFDKPLQPYKNMM